MDGQAHYISAWDYLGPVIDLPSYNCIATKLRTKYKLEGEDILNRLGEMQLSP